MDAIELTLFSNQIAAICEEMGLVLRHAAFSPNIRDRLDYSCAIFDANGELCAQAAHIPVHLGSMAFAMRGIVGSQDWQPGDMLVLNDPFLGGTHLPDVTMVAPFFLDEKLLGFVANRAHHADIGASTPGSMPVSKSLEEEGIIIPPTLLIRAGELQQKAYDSILSGLRNAVISRGDFEAQISANKTGLQRLENWVQTLGVDAFQSGLVELNAYAERLAQDAFADLPDGTYAFKDFMDDDGAGHENLPISVTVEIGQGKIRVDFSGTALQTAGNINCPLSVAAAGVYYVFRCLMPSYTPAAAGSFRAIEIVAPEGSLLNAQRPAAVAAGNVETSTRVVDVVMGALAQAVPQRMAAASHGSMNNLAMGGSRCDANGNENGHWDYYETIGGGMGAHRYGAGLSGVQTHMTNTLNTPVEVLEMNYPLRVEKYAIRKNSGGVGQYRGGDGLERQFRFLESATVTLLTERRMQSPWGLDGGKSGEAGENWLDDQLLPPKCTISVQKGQTVTVKTPGGGGVEPIM